MFVNLTNHPSLAWSDGQRQAALQYGEILDLPFPVIDPAASTEEVKALADKTVDAIKQLDGSPVVHVMGEMTFTYAIVARLKALGITCVASTTERDTVVAPDGRKITTFKFVRFREY